MITPQININGTSRDDLINPRRDAIDHLMDAVEALKQVTPNGRDYPGNPDGCAADRNEHYQRIGSLMAIREAIYAEAIRIVNNEA